MVITPFKLILISGGGNKQCHQPKVIAKVACRFVSRATRFSAYPPLPPKYPLLYLVATRKKVYLPTKLYIWSSFLSSILTFPLSFIYSNVHICMSPNWNKQLEQVTTPPPTPPLSTSSRRLIQPEPSANSGRPPLLVTFCYRIQCCSDFVEEPSPSFMTRVILVMSQLSTELIASSVT